MFRPIALIAALALIPAAAAFAEVTVTAGTGQLAYARTGSGPALVIIHGVGGRKEDWASLAADLADRRTVYAIDMLGFGGSSRDADPGIASQTAAVLALLDAEGIAQSDFLGNSVGGWVAATFASTHPERTRRLILANPAGFAAMLEGPPPVNLFPQTLAEMRALLDAVIAADFARSEAFAQDALDALAASGERAIAPRLFPALAASATLETVMPRIAAPTLVIWGERDGLFPVALAPSIAGLTPGATLTVIPDAAHFPQIDQPEAVRDAVRAFLD
jgi:triacylglycerol lipase